MIAFDCHAHVYERVVAAGKPRYLPHRPAPLSEWRHYHDAHGLKGGVIVQTSFFDVDNSELVGALAKLDPRRFAGVAGIAMTADVIEMEALRRLGIRGARWNLVEGTSIPDLDAPRTRAFLDRLNHAGLHLEIHLEGRRLAALLPRLVDRIDRLVIDHFGLPQEPDPRDEPWLQSLDRCAARDRVWVKFSAPYRSAVPVGRHAAAILDLLGPGQVIWGSDWPWTRHEGRVDYPTSMQWAQNWFSVADETAVERLYGLRVGGNRTAQ